MSTLPPAHLSAAAPPVTSNHVGVSAPSHATSGQIVQLSGEGFSPGSTVQIVLDTPKRVVVGSAVAQPDGEFHADVKMPKTKVGGHELQVEGISSTGKPEVWASKVVVVSHLTQDLATSPSVAGPVLLGLSLGIPLATWCALQLPGRGRRRSAGSPRSAGS